MVRVLIFFRNLKNKCEICYKCIYYKSKRKCYPELNTSWRREGTSGVDSLLRQKTEENDELQVSVTLSRGRISCRPSNRKVDVSHNLFGYFGGRNIPAPAGIRFRAVRLVFGSWHVNRPMYHVIRVVLERAESRLNSSGV